MPAAHAQLAKIAARGGLPRVAAWMQGEPAIAAALTPGGRSKLVLVQAATGDVNAYVTQRHYLGRGRTMAQIGYWLLLDPPTPILPGGSAQRAPKGQPWTIQGVPIAGAVLYAYPRVSKRLYGYHPMEIIELARLYLEPGPDGRNPPGLASRALRATASAVEGDWQEAYPNLPAPRGIVSWADTTRHTGAIYRASGFVELGQTRGGKTETRKGGPAHADLDAPKLAYVLPLRPPLPQSNYALRLILYGVTREGADELCDFLSAEARAMGLALPGRDRRCFFERGLGGEFILPLGPAGGATGSDEAGPMALGDVAARLGDLFVELAADVDYEEDSDWSWEVIHFTGAHYTRDKKAGGQWKVRDSQESTMSVHDLDDPRDNPAPPPDHDHEARRAERARARAPKLAAVARRAGMGALARWIESAAPWGDPYASPRARAPDLIGLLAGPRPGWLVNATVDDTAADEAPYYPVHNGMRFVSWGPRVFATNAPEYHPPAWEGERAKPPAPSVYYEVKPTEIAEVPAFLAAARVASAAEVEDMQRLIDNAWSMTDAGHEVRRRALADRRFALGDVAARRVAAMRVGGRGQWHYFSASAPTDNPPSGLVRPGERVTVSRIANGWSIRSERTGRVVAHTPTADLVNAVRTDGGIEGNISDTLGAPLDLSTWQRVIYDPAAFRRDLPGAHATRGPVRAYCDEQGRVVADRPIPVEGRVRRNPGDETEIVLDSEGRKYPARYEVVEVALDGRSTVMVSHDPADLTRWTPGYPPAFQSRDLGSMEEQAKINTIARKLDPIRLLAKNLDPTLGAPVVWEAPDGRLPALGGNGRILGFIKAPDERYAAYLSMGRKLWPCFPTYDARTGHRWMLLRVVSGIDQATATQLAAASQMSTAAEEGRLGKALSLLRSLDLRMEALPPFTWLAPLARDNMGEFWDKNRGFVQSILSAMDSAKRASYENDPDRLTPVVQAVMLGFLPPEAKRPGVWDDPKVEDALFGAMPAMITIRSMVQSGRLFPEVDLLSALPDALDVFAVMRARRWSFRQVKEQIEGDRQQARIEGTRRISDVGDLGMALAAAFHNAARRAAPEVAIADILGRYFEAIADRDYDPKHIGLFGGPTAPNAGAILARIVPGFLLPGEADDKASPEGPALFGAAANPRRNPRSPARLIFAGDRYKPSDARSWCKRHNYHAGVPRINAQGDVQIEQGGPEGRRVVALDHGVIAIVAG